MMTVIEGDLPFFEGRLVSKLLARRVLGWLRLVWIPIVFAAAASGGAMGIWLAAYGDTLPGVAVIAVLALYGLVIVGGLMLSNRILHAASQRRWAARGVPAMGHIAVRVTDDALRIEALTATTIVPWRYVSELAIEKRYLMFIVAGMTYFVPRRFFADPVQERAFVAAAVARLEPGALVRSSEAVGLAGAVSG